MRHLINCSSAFEISGFANCLSVILKATRLLSSNFYVCSTRKAASARTPAGRRKVSETIWPLKKSENFTKPCIDRKTLASSSLESFPKKGCWKASKISTEKCPKHFRKGHRPSPLWRHSNKLFRPPSPSRDRWSATASFASEFEVPQQDPTRNWFLPPRCCSSTSSTSRSTKASLKGKTCFETLQT